MRNFLAILFIASFLNSSAQFAIVSDNSGLLNVREDGLAGSRVVDRLPNGHLVYTFESKGNWINIDYTKNGKERNGYVYKDRLTQVSGFQKFSITQKTGNTVSLKKDSMEVTIIQGRFDRKKHKLTYFRDNPDQIQWIDNKQYWGTDGGLPKTQYEKIIIRWGNKPISLPRSALENLYEPGIYSAEAYYDPQTDTLYIETMNSDGAGSYEVIWKVTNGVYADRLVAYGF